MSEKDLEISVNVRQTLEEMANASGLSLERLEALLLEAFVEGDGKIFVGNWREGPGIRVLPDWPRFTSCVKKVKTENMR